MPTLSIEQLIALFILTGAAWPLVNVCVSRPFWRTFPHLGRKAIALVLAYIIFVTVIALFFRQALVPLALAAAGVLLYLGWRARPGHGQRKNLPPGSLALLPLGPWFDEQFFHKQADRYGSIFKASYFFQPMVCIVGLPVGLELLHRHDEVLGTPPLPFSRFIPGGYLRYMDPGVHRSYKRIFRGIFSPEVVRDSKIFMERDIADGLQRMEEACVNHCSGKGLQPKPYINRMLFSVWVRLFTGISPDSKDAEQLQRCLQIIDMRNPMRVSDTAINLALDEITEILHRQMNAFTQREMQQSRIPSCFLAALCDSCTESKHDATVLRNFIYLMHVTWSDVAGLLLWILKMLSDYPEWLSKVRASAENDKLSECIVMETLRLEQSEHLYRRALQDIHFNGFLIPKNWIVRICIRESHQNPDAFSEPTRFNPDRFLDKTYRETEYLPFGAARLACLGQFLTKTTGKIFVEVLARRYNIQITDDGPREFGSWRHWRPSTKYRVNLARI